MILVGCEFSGRVRDAFIAAGHEAVSCDLLPTESLGPHIQGDLLEVIDDPKWSLGIFFPPCTDLCSSGMHWTTRGLRDPQLTEDAIVFVRRLMACRIPRIALENPIGAISTRIRKPDQIIQPWMFGEDASKSTCLWIRNLPLLRPTAHVEPRIVNGRKRWGNQTDSGQNKLAPSPTRWADRSETYLGIARAMAAQWGPYLAT